MKQGDSNRNIFRNCGGGAGPGAGAGPEEAPNFGKCNFGLSVLVCMFHLLSPQRRPTTKKHTCKNAPASSQSGVIPVTHKGPFLCHSLADPGRMCDILMCWDMQTDFDAVAHFNGTPFFWVFLLIAN